MTVSRLFRPETRNQAAPPLGRLRCVSFNNPWNRPVVVLLMKAHPQEQGFGHSAPSASTTRRRSVRNRALGVGAVIAPPASSSTTPQGPRSARPPPLLQVQGGLGGLGRPVLLNYRCRSFPRSLFTSSSPLPPFRPGCHCQHRESLTRPRFLLPLHIPLHSFSGHSLFSRRRDRFDPASRLGIFLHLQPFHDNDKMKGVAVAAAAAVFASGVAAHDNHRRAHRAGLFDKRTRPDTAEICVPQCTTIYSTITGEPARTCPPAPREDKPRCRTLDETNLRTSHTQSTRRLPRLSPRPPSGPRTARSSRPRFPTSARRPAPTASRPRP